MALVPLISPAQFRNELQKVHQKIVNKAIKLLHRLGEQSVNYARIYKGYVNQTSNLISSIGYIIKIDGVVIDSVFDYDEANPEGQNNGRKVAESFGRKYKKGFVLIVVAGMNYAQAVEAKGKDVITGSSIFIKQKFAEMARKMNEKL